MLDFPQTMPLAVLSRRHPDYVKYMDTWRILKQLREGSTAMLHNLEYYLPKRPGEKDTHYHIRLNKFCYTPVMNTAIREFVSKLVTAPVVVSNAEDPWWDEFIENSDGKYQDEQELLSKLFGNLLYYGRIHVSVDRKANPVARSAAEDPALPYLLIWDPIAVTQWGDGWFLTYQELVTMEPFKDPVIKDTRTHRYTFWADGAIAVYEARGAATVATLVKYDKLDTMPMVTLTLPFELWIGNSAYLKQIQHTRIESAWTESGSMAGYIQRVFTPSNNPDDPRILPRSDYSDLQADPGHILIGDNFRFVESTGSAIGSLTDQLEKIETQIRLIVSMGFASSDARSQSGVSKQVDMSLLQDSMRSYGKKVAQLYQDILQMVAKYTGRSEMPNVQGLDSYNTDVLADILKQTEILAAIETRIPLTAQRIWYNKLCKTLTGSTSQEDNDKIQDELEQLFTSGAGDVNYLMETFGVDKETATQMVAFLQQSEGIV